MKQENTNRFGKRGHCEVSSVCNLVDLRNENFTETKKNPYN